jgi:hypothetical protein
MLNLAQFVAWGKVVEIKDRQRVGFERERPD